MTVHTLQIDGVECAGSADQTVLEVARENGIAIPTLCHLDGLCDVGACRLCVVEVQGKRQAAARLHDAGRRRDGHHDGVTAPAGIPPHDHRDALRRAQPRVRGMRGEQQLRTAGARRASSG